MGPMNIYGAPRFTPTCELLASTASVLQQQNARALLLSCLPVSLFTGTVPQGAAPVLPAYLIVYRDSTRACCR